MNDIELAAEDLADALGPDLTYLQPPGEQRFDPVSVGVIVGLWLLKAVAEGIRDGIVDAAADRTKEALPTVTGKVRSLVPEWVRRAFSRPDSGPPTEAEVADTQEAIASAGDAAVKLGPEFTDGLPAAVADAVREVLAARGLPPGTAVRVREVIRVQIEIAVSRDA